MAYAYAEQAGFDFDQSDNGIDLIRWFGSEDESKVCMSFFIDLTELEVISICDKINPNAWEQVDIAFNQLRNDGVLRCACEEQPTTPTTALEG